ncbi:MAG: hypothetical protein IJH75_01535 [Mogibacterium sp.]|nr:hypothetical protein [Mogibacterium sp.]
MRRAAGRSGKILVLMLLVVLFGTTFAGASAGDGSVRINGPDVGEEVAGDREEPAETEEADPGGETGSPQEDGSEEAADLGGAEGPDAEPVAPGAPEAEEDAAEEAAPEEPGEAEELPDPGDPDETLYDICYLMRHADRAYVDTADGIPFQAMVQPVTAARGVATYNAKKQKAFDVTEQNFIASMAYDVPVYDIDEDSRYYVAVPDVNPGSKTFGSYDVVLTYNNNNGETIPGYHYKDGVLYIPKSAVDDPQNEAELITPSPLAMQINYYFKGGVDADREGNADFSKKIPVQILNGREPERRTVTVDNLFDSCVTVPVGDVSEEDVHVMVNGMMLPLGGDAYDVRDGELTVYSPAAVLSGINIVIEKRRLSLSGLLRHFAGEVYADTTVTPDQMAYFRDEKGNYVTLNIDLDRLFVGWRGVYTGAKIQYSGSSMPGNTGSGAHNEGRIRALMALKGWSNSVNYLYGPYVAGNSQGGNNPQDIVGIWAIDSYTLGKNKAFSTSDTLTADMLVTNDVEGNGGETTRKTIYDWMRQYAGTLELNNGQVGNTQSASQGGNVNSNGIGGFTNFAFQFPKTVQGSGTNLVPAGNPGAGQVNEAITFASDEIDSSYFVAATCSHLDEAAATDGSGEATVYVSCLSIGEDYAVFSFVGADSHSQDGAAIYKFKTGTPVRVRKTSALPEISGDNRCYSLAGATYKL